MTTQRPCIIVKSNNLSAGRDRGFTAYNEDGRYLIEFLDYYCLGRYLNGQGYDVVPHNSRVGRTILDKIHNERV